MPRRCNGSARNKSPVPLLVLHCGPSQQGDRIIHEDYRLIYSGGEDSRHGVGFLVADNVAQSYKSSKHVFPVATYACETWIFRRADENRITAFENKCYRKILRVRWVQRRTNKSVRAELNVTPNWLLQYARRQKLSYFGHIWRHKGIEKSVLEAYIPGRRRRGRPRYRWEKTIIDAFGSMTRAGRTASDRTLFRKAVRAATL